MHRAADHGKHRLHLVQGVGLSPHQHRQGSGPGTLGATGHRRIEVAHTLAGQPVRAAHSLRRRNGGAIQHNASRPQAGGCPIVAEQHGLHRSVVADAQQQYINARSGFVTSLPRRPKCCRGRRRSQQSCRLCSRVSKPALIRFAAIGRPRAPRPTTPSFRSQLPMGSARRSTGETSGVDGWIRRRRGRPHRAAPCLPAARGWRHRRWRCGTSCRPGRPSRQQPRSHRRR